MAEVRKAVITAAGLGTRHYPATQVIQKELIPLVDADGTTKPTLQIVVEEAVASGIEEVCIVVSPASEPQIRRHFQGLPDEMLPHFEGRGWALEEAQQLRALGERITYVVQEKSEGYGHAVFCARHFVGDEPFLLLLGDHVLLSDTDVPCSRQVIEVYQRFQCPVSGVQRTPEDQIHLFGTLTGRPVPDHPGVYEVTEIKEKPDPDYAERHLRTPGLKRGEYLCFFGMHIYPPAIFDCLHYSIRHDMRVNGEIQLTPAQDLLRERMRYLAAEIEGLRCDMGVPFGLIYTQLALALRSPLRRRLLGSLTQLRDRRQGSE